MFGIVCVSFGVCLISFLTKRFVIVFFKLVDPNMSAAISRNPHGRVAVLGGSIAGMLAARELGREGVDVTVYEEHREIGVPEKCDGLVSVQGIEELGVVPPSHSIQNELKRAIFFSPSLKEIKLEPRRQNVIVLDRNRFDKYLAELAAKNGAKVDVGKRVSNYAQDDEKVSFSVENETRHADYLIDCGGYESYINAGGGGLQGGLYLVYGKWFEKHTVEVYFDSELYPGFFKWVIPISDEIAKIGVAGDGINTFQILDKFASERKATVLRKMAAPVLCYGVSKSLVTGRVCRAGDAAGQAKPTTGGGIYTGGYGGMKAGSAAARAVKTGDTSKLSLYEESWNKKFGKEFRFQLMARGAFSKFDNVQIERLFEMLAVSDIPKKISDEGDFDMHSVAIVKALGFAKSVSAFGMVFSNEFKALLGF